jgi:MacB-like protein
LCWRYGVTAETLLKNISPEKRQKRPAKFDRQSLACNSGETFVLYTFNQAHLEDNMKSSAPVAVAGVLGCILIAGCVQTREANVPNPPASSYQVVSFELQDSGSSRQVRGASVTPAFFQSAKVSPLLGRGFLPEEYSSGRQQVVMVSQRFWQQQWSGDPRIIGTTMHLNGQTFTVIGIMPTMFDVPSGVDIWVPKAG